MNEDEICFGIINALQNNQAKNLCPGCFQQAHKDQIDIDPLMQDTGVCDECGSENELAYHPIIVLQQNSGIDPKIWWSKYPRISRRKNKI